MTVAPQALSVTPSGAAVPPAMSQAVMKALSKDADQRFATTKEFYDAFSSGGALSAVPVTPPLPPPPNFLLTPALNPSTGPVDRRRSTQIGEPAYGPAAGYAPISGTWNRAGSLSNGRALRHAGRGKRGLSGDRGDPPWPPTAGAEEWRGAGRGCWRSLGLLGVLSAAAVWIALTRHPFLR